jgi:hypothetical protein
VNTNAPFACVAGIAICVALNSGCQPADEWNRAAVKGTVTLDGQPLPTGQITFFPAGDTTGPAAGGEIAAGQFSLDAREGPVVGRNRIEIRSVQKTGKMVKSPVAVEADGAAVAGMLVEEFADVVPKRYNTYSELEQEIQPDKVNEMDFSLMSAKPTSPR